MRFAWQRRADEEQRKRIADEKRLDEIEADWPKVREAAAVTRAHRELNGWTGIVADLFANSNRGGGTTT